MPPSWCRAFSIMRATTDRCSDTSGSDPDLAPGGCVPVACVLPWRGGQPERERHHETVRAHLETLLPDAVHIDADSGPTPSARAASRNHGARHGQDAAGSGGVSGDAATPPET